MKIKILNKNEIRNYKPENNNFLIRMGKQLSLEFEEYYDSINVFHFSDFEYESQYTITEFEAKEIVNIFKENKNTNEFIVHCSHAQGRSPALAIAFCYYLYGEDIYNFKEKYPHYNKLILKKLRNYI